MTLGQKITSLRKARGMTQEELSESIGVTRQTISKWEQDASTPDLEYLCKLCDLFGVTADYLIRPEREAMETTPLAHPEPVNPPPTPPSSGKQISGIRFTGWVLFILGLVLSQVAILLLLFGLDSTILWFLTGVCIVIGLELFLIRWKPLFIVMWTVWLIWTFIQFVLNSHIYILSP
ncbi:MAG: helix-turn-helix domain-containing protein [Clostridia bacterium]|nr:helix-turn-helix domain-containing protein [Clostridia bacterium]